MATKRGRCVPCLSRVRFKRPACSPARCRYVHRPRAVLWTTALDHEKPKRQCGRHGQGERAAEQSRDGTTEDGCPPPRQPPWRQEGYLARRLMHQQQGFGVIAGGREPRQSTGGGVVMVAATTAHTSSSSHKYTLCNRFVSRFSSNHHLARLVSCQSTQLSQRGRDV